MSPHDRAALRFCTEAEDPAAAYSREIAAIRAEDARKRAALLDAAIAAIGAAGWVRPAPAPRTPEAELRVQIGMAWLNAQRKPL
jgi:hypothetical protein